MPAKGAVDISNVIRKWAARVMRILLPLAVTLSFFISPLTILELEFLFEQAQIIQFWTTFHTYNGASAECNDSGQ